MRSCTSTVFLILLSTLSLSSLGAERGRIEGTVRDRETKSVLIGTHVSLLGTSTGATTDLEGRFQITGLAPGNYAIRFSHVGYEQVIRTDIIVRPDRTTGVDAELAPLPYETEEVAATPGYFAENGPTRLSSLSFSAEEIRRAPGAAGDVSRIMMSLPSVAKVNDQSNGLIVRGGSPMENAFFVDDIEIPNINHFPVQGTSSGPISLINIDLVRDVRFSTGGFAAPFGDRLSSIMELEFREGNRQRFEGQLDLNFLGFGGVAEGPIGSAGSWLVSLRRSYLDLIVAMIDIGTSVAPRYGDLQWKVVYDLDQQNQLEFLGVWSDDWNSPDSTTALENDMLYYGHEKIDQRTAGLGWRRLWAQGYSRTTLSFSSSVFETSYNETGSHLPLLFNHAEESALSLRNVNHFRISQPLALTFGIEWRLPVGRYDQTYPPSTDPLGEPVAEGRIDTTLRRQQVGAFASAEISLSSHLSMTVGLRADYSALSGDLLFSPRFSAGYRLTETTTLNAGVGLYRQNIPLVLYAQGSSKELPPPQAIHYIFGIEHLLTPSTRLTLEAYVKEYRNLPVDPSQSTLFLLDELYYSYGFFTYHGALSSEGRGRARGVELILQKKLAEEFYGLASASYSLSEYQNGGGAWTDRVCDNRVTFSMEAGYKPNNEWEFSARWIYAGGRPYTPFDIARSSAEHRGIFDGERVNADRYPAYHSLNVRVDKRFHFASSNLVSYLSIWNVYQRKNVATYFWKQAENVQGTIYQWGLVPVFGLEYEF